MVIIKEWIELVVIKHLEEIMARPHPPTTADQAEQVGRDEHFNRPPLRETFRSYKDTGKFIREAWIARYGKEQK